MFFEMRARTWVCLLVHKRSRKWEQRLFLLWSKEAGTQKDISNASLIRQHLERFGGSEQWNCDFKTAAFAFFTQKGIKTT